MRPPVEVTVYNRQRKHPLDTAKLGALACLAVGLCLPKRGTGSAVLVNLTEVEVFLVSDRRMATVHRQFMGIPGTTDVITFEHGEILISAATAARCAVDEGETTVREVCRYIVHGLLHLNGHLDKAPAEAARMWKAQEEVLEAIWPQQRP